MRRTVGNTVPYTVAGPSLCDELYLLEERACNVGNDEDISALVAKSVGAEMVAAFNTQAASLLTTTTSAIMARES